MSSRVKRSLVVLVIVASIVAVYCSYRMWNGSAAGRALPLAPGTLADWVAAFATFFAAVSALWIATADRRERREERRDAARAQAKMVFVVVTRPVWQTNVGTAGYHGDFPWFGVGMRNLGAQSIIEVVPYSATMTAIPSAQPHGLGTERDVLVKGVFENVAKLAFTDSLGQPLPHGTWDAQGTWWCHDWEDLGVEVTVHFTDFGGNRWARSSTGALELFPRRGHGVR